ncbi:MAG: peptidoglycan DD-metalloendopeptidase family protein [Porticoccaceae bacterium]|nr:peptidoglycan DD-metalloendopeptidase family protein [Porticoccaceae bacterium]
MSLDSRFKSPVRMPEAVWSILRAFPQRHLIASVLVAGAVVVMLVLPGGKEIEKRQVIESVELEFRRVDSAAPAAAPDVVVQSQPTLRWRSAKVKDGDNLSTMFVRAGVSAGEIYNLTASPGGDLLGNLYPGDQFRIGIDATDKVIQLEYIKSPLIRYIFAYEDGNYRTEKRTRKADVLLGFRQGIIRDSLYNSGKRAQLPDSIIMEMANIFGWDIDFVFDIREGDQFSLLFEERYLDGVQLGAGDIIAASFTNRGKTFRAVRYQNSDGSTQYYSPDGLSMRKTFLRTPLDIFRISSGFNLKRKHPIHKKIKAHRGVDYAAPRGTPVYAVGKGKVVKAGFHHANGNYIFIQHGQTYTTKYLHLHKKKVKVGQTVSQKMMIGTVGSTGYSTGPHLHYEFLVNGVHKNPRTVKLPQADPIPVNESERFERTTKPLLVKLAIYEQASQQALGSIEDAANVH